MKKPKKIKCPKCGKPARKGHVIHNEKTGKGWRIYIHRESIELGMFNVIHEHCYVEENKDSTPEK